MTDVRLFRLEHTATDDTGPIQTVDALGHAGETLEKVLRIQPHGFASNPPAGSHGLGLRLRDQSELAVALGLEHQDKRPKYTKAGNSVVYDAAGNVSRYQGDDGIWHDAGSRPQKLTGKTVTIAADGGNVTVSVEGGKIYLGGDGKKGSYARVMTEDGPSSVVYAKL